MKVNELIEGKGPGANLSDELYVALAKANVEKDVIDALRRAMAAASTNTYAMSYAHAMTKSFDQFGIDGVKFQVMYMLNNMGSWKGEEARNAKKILKKWIK